MIRKYFKIEILLFFSFFFVNCSVFGQSNPQVLFASTISVIGRADLSSTVHISTDTDFKPEYSIKVDKNGNFNINFNAPLNVGDNIIIWSVNSKDEISQRILVKIEKPESILQNFGTKSISLKNFSNIAVDGKTVKYKATIWNTNFSIPLARFNFTKDDKQKTGNLILFNSVGAGFGISRGELSESRDVDGKIVNQEFVNKLGVHFGFLFSAGTGEDTKNIFAPTINFSLLDFQFGAGYELGTLSENQKPFFLTLSYAIPLYKLKKGSFWIWRDTSPIINSNDSRLGD